VKKKGDSRREERQNGLVGVFDLGRREEKLKKRGEEGDLR
jgi:hypothetical protein